MDKVKLLGTNADASLSFSLCWFLLVLNYFFLQISVIYFFMCMFQNISDVLISVQTGCDDTAMIETCKSFPSNVIICKAIQEVPDLK